MTPDSAISNTAADTWGISGPQFTALYAGGLVLAVLLTAAIRRAVLRPARSLTPAPLSLDELAYLSGGAGGLGASAVIGLRERGEVVSPKKSTISATNRPLDPSATPAQQALHRELSTKGDIALGKAGTVIARTRAGHGIRESLIDRGLITDAGRRARLKLPFLFFLGLIAVGVLRINAGTQHNKPVTYVVLLLIVTAVASLVSMRAPLVTPAGKRWLKAARTESEPLRGASLPGDRALAVALFGVGALWLVEPGLADELGFSRAVAASPTSTDTSWSSSSDSGSSCGGGGSSCGGSSCGGGCGGGGCGG